MEFLKPILGDELFSQVQAALKDNKDVKLANLATGDYVGKDKFAAIEAEKKTLAEQIRERDERINTLQKVDAASLQKKIEELEAEKQTREIDHAIDLAIIKAKGKNPKIIKAALDPKAIKIDGDSVTGIEDQVDALRKTDAYLFDASAAAFSPGANPPNQSPNSAEEIEAQCAALVKAGKFDQAVALRNTMYKMH
jgi:hypothetical protein